MVEWLSCLCILLVSFMILTPSQAQISNSGTISWVNFDNLTISPSPTRTFYMYHMPRKTNWTGIVALNVFDDNTNGYFDQIYFTSSASGLPPSFSNQDMVIDDWNAIQATGTHQLLATGGDGSEDWYILFSGSVDPAWVGPVTIGFYIIEMQTMEENVASVPIMLLAGQSYLFKITAEGDPFEAGDMIQITTKSASGECLQASSVAVGHIPTVDQEVSVSKYVYLDGNGTDLFYPMVFLADCSGFTVTVGRIYPRPTIVDIGDTIVISNFTSQTKLLVRSKEALPLITITGDLSDFISLLIYTSNDNFQFKNLVQMNAMEPDSLVWDGNTDDLTAKYWYFIISGNTEGENGTLSFSIPDDTSSLSTPYEYDRDPGPATPSAYDVVYTFDSCSALCISGDENSFTPKATIPNAPSTDKLAQGFFPSFSNLTDPDNGALSLLCIAKPPSLSYINLTVMLEINFAYSLAPATFITFYELPQNNFPFGTLRTPTTEINGMFFDYIQSNSSEASQQGGLIYLEVEGSFQYFTFTPDDWSLNFAAMLSYDGPFLFSAPTTGHGWYVMAQFTDPTFNYRISSVDATHIVIPDGSTVSSAILTTFQMNDTIVGLVRISVPNPSSVVHLNFSTSFTYAIAQANSMPTVYDQNSLYTYQPPPDVLGLTPSYATNTTFITIPALAFQTGVISQDFYAIVYFDASVLSNPVQVTANWISEVIVDSKESLPITINAGVSSLPQVFRVPYTAELLVVSTSLSVPSTNSSNVTLLALFGAGGFQVIPKDDTTQPPLVGLHLSPLVDYFYASNFTYDYYFLVYANSPPLTLTITPSKTFHLCNPVLMCNGHGLCHEDRSSDSCICIQGFGYGFSGNYCADIYNHLIWLTVVIAGGILFVLVLVKVLSSFICGKSKRSEEGESLLIQSDQLSKHLVRVYLSLDNVGLVAGKAQLLDGISAELKAGELTAVMGPSGAGKTSIMRVLSGRSVHSAGSIRVNGNTVQKLGQYRSLIGYVPQEDVMNPLLTVKENIMHSALMRLPSNGELTKAEKERLVSVVINALGLSAKQDVIVGDLGGRSSLSGGQRKRVSIGMELVMCPSILLLDEPTSGLDSKTALALTTLLKTQITTLGINVIMVVHQPRYEILSACNNVLLLADGKVKYFGSPEISELSRYFPRLQANANGRVELDIGINIADLLLDHIEEFTYPQKSNNSINSITTSNSYETKKALQPRNLPSFFLQLYLLTKRAFQQVVRDVRSAIILYGLTLFSAILIGMLYRDSAFIGPPSPETVAKCPVGLQFLCAQNQSDTYMVQGLLICLSLGLTACASSLFTFGGTEKLVFARESTTGQSNLAYFIAKSIGCLPNMLLAPFVFMSVFQVLTTPDVPFWKLYVIALGIVMVCMNVAHIMSILLADSRALTVSVVTICISNVISGFNPSLPQLKNSLGEVVGTALPALSYSRWSIEAYYLSVLEPYKNIYNVDISLHMWDYAWSHSSVAFGVPFAIGILISIISAIILIWKKQP